MDYNIMYKNIRNKCLINGYEGATIGGEAFEEIINDSLLEYGIPTDEIQWNRYSKKPEGRDLNINTKRISVKTCIQKGHKIVLSGYRLTKCKTFQEHLIEIINRDSSYDYCLVSVRLFTKTECVITIYEIPKQFLELSHEFQQTKNGFKTSLLNGKGNVSISFSASHQLSISLHINDIEPFKLKTITITKDEVRRCKNLICSMMDSFE